MGKFMGGGLRCKGWFNSVIISVITNVITCMDFWYNVKICIVYKDSFKCKYIVVKAISYKVGQTVHGYWHSG